MCCLLYTSAAPRVLLDPNTLSTDGTVALAGYSASEDGKWLAYGLSRAGSDWEEWRVRDVATGEDRSDLVEWVKFSGAAWKKDGSGFYYSSFGVPRNEAERAEFLKHAAVFHKLYFHKLGTPQSDDKIVFEQPNDKEMLIGGGVSEDGRWLFLSQSKGHNLSLIHI